jgi:hypothetical protein
MNYYQTKQGKVLFTNSVINNTEVIKIEKPKSDYELMYCAHGLKVERFDRPSPIGTEYKVTRGMVSFTTSINPIVPFQTAQVLNEMIEDYISMSNEDYSEADFTEVEILN